jgi:hypothetical protein
MRSTRPGCVPRGHTLEWSENQFCRGRERRRWWVAGKQGESGSGAPLGFGIRVRLCGAGAGGVRSCQLVGVAGWPLPPPASPTDAARRARACPTMRPTGHAKLAGWPPPCDGDPTADGPTIPPPKPKGTPRHALDHHRGRVSLSILARRAAHVAERSTRAGRRLLRSKTRSVRGSDRQIPEPHPSGSARALRLAAAAAIGYTRRRVRPDFPAPSAPRPSPLPVRPGSP